MAAKLHLMKAKNLPAKGNPGDHYIVNGKAHIATKSGVIVPIEDFMTNVSVGPAGARGEQGPAGNVMVVGPQELKNAVAKLRAQRAQFAASLQLGLEEAAALPGPHASLVKNHLMKLKQRAGI